MPITLITGLPGHGKTLYTLATYRDIAAKMGRPVYYNGIKDLKLPWTEIEPEAWETLPPTSILIVDEAQFKLPLRGRGTPAEWIERLAVHRHAGIDIVLITQNPMLIDSFVRRLVDRHFHVVRKFGTKFATIHEFANGVCDQVAKSRNGSITHEWRYPKDVFDLYHSAEVHTVKSRIPARVWLFLVLPFLLLGLGWYIYHRLTPAAVADRSMGAAGSAGAAASAPGPGIVPAGVAGPGGLVAGSPQDVDAYLLAQKPRIPGLAYTAPVYDEVVKPTSAPYPAACVASKSVCRCYSQQATVLDVPDTLCRSIAGGGFFAAWNSAGERVQKTSGTSSPGQVVAGTSGEWAAPSAPVDGPASPVDAVPGRHRPVALAPSAAPVPAGPAGGRAAL